MIVPSAASDSGPAAEPLLLLRADASADIGAGHVVRSVALAQAWARAGGRAALATTDLPDPVRQFVTKAGVEVVVLPNGAGAGPFLQAVASHRPTAIVIDHYEFDERSLEALPDGPPTLLITDGERAGQLPVDALLDQNAPVAESDYPASCRGPRLLGPRFVLLRDEVIRAGRRASGAARTDVSIATVVFGGSDPLNLGPATAQELVRLLPSAHIRLVRGSLASRTPVPDGVEVVDDPPDISQVWVTSDLVVSAAGSTCWELAHLRVPMVAVVTVDNQRRVADTLGANDLADVASTPDPAEIASRAAALAADRRRRAGLAERGRAVVDGRGADRVVEVIGDLVASRR